MKNLVTNLFIAIMTGVSFPVLVYAASAPVDTQQQIIAQKEQEQASKRAEQELQHRVSQGMTKSQLQGRRLEAFVLPEEENSFKIKSFELFAPKYGYKFGWIEEYLAQFTGQKIGVKGINELLNR
jgi:hemolysin activation/secretion protein